MIVRFFLIVCIFGFLASTHGIDVVDLPENKTTTTTTTTTTSTTTTETPKTTTEAPKTTTIAPKPEPTYLSGQLENKAENYTCLRYEFNVHFNIEYNTTDPNKTATASFQLPLDSKLDYLPTVCSDVNSESFNLTFGSNVLELTFKKTESSVFMDNILLTVNMTNETFPNVEKNLLNTFETFNITNFSPNFNVDKSHSYVCANNVSIPREDGPFHAVFSNLRLQAFMEKSQNGTFSDEHNCQNEINDVVPIAVGAALTALVIVVLIAYIIGRRRSRRLAYQSV